MFNLKSELAGYGCNYKLIVPNGYFLKLHFDDISFTDNQGYIDVYYKWESNKKFIHTYNNSDKGKDVIIRGRLV